MVVKHNLQAMNSNRMFGITSKTQQAVTEKLSSGYRINKAADDAAGLSISEKMRRQIRGLTQASLNCQDGISLVQTADGAMAEIHEMLDRCTELSVKAANGTLTDVDRGYIQSEIAAIKEEIDDIKEKVTFNEIQVLKGKDVEAEASTGGAAVIGGMPAWAIPGDNTSIGNKKLSDTVTVGGTDYLGMTFDFSAINSNPGKINDLKDEDTGFYTTCCTCSNHYSVKFVNGPAENKKSGDHYIYEVSLDGVTNGEQLVDKILAATGSSPEGHYTSLAKDPTNPAKLIVYENRKAYAPTYSPRSNPGSNYGLAGEGIAYAEDQIPASKPVDIFIQADAEANRHIDIQLPSISCKVMKIDRCDVSTISGADSAITAFKKAKEYVSTERSRMGAYQNRLEHTINNLDNVVENTTAAESQIRDTDMATYMVQFANNNVLLQAGQAMLSSANQTNDGVLSLLQ